MPEKRKRDEKRREKEKKEIAENTKIFEGVVSISSLSHGEAGLGSFHRYARPPAKTHEAWVYGGGGARGLLHVVGPCVPCNCGRICGVLYGIL
jgi:hypothetical protein